MQVQIWDGDGTRQSPPPEAAGLLLSTLSPRRVKYRTQFAAAKFVVAGVARFQACGRTLELFPGDMAIVGAGVDVEATVDGPFGDGFSFYVDTARTPHAPETPFLSVDPQTSEFGAMMSRVNAAFSAHLAGAGVRDLYEALPQLSEAFTPMVRQAREGALRLARKRDETSFALSSRVHSAYRALQRDMAGDLTLDQVARQVGMSKHHFAHVFKEAHGVSPIAFRDAVRLERARSMIADGASVMEAALLHGYPDTMTFSKAFRRQFGAAPTKLQRG